MFCWSPRTVALLKEYPKCRNIYQTRCKFTVEDFVEIIAQLIIQNYDKYLDFIRKLLLLHIGSKHRRDIYVDYTNSHCIPPLPVLVL